MKTRHNKTSFILLELLLTISLIVYILIFIGETFLTEESVPLLDTVGIIILFILFLVGYYFSWKNQRISGIIIVGWYVIELIFGFFVWDDAGMVILLGFPVFILGILLIIYSLKHKKKK